MKRKNFYLTEHQLEYLDEESKKIGITISELIRRIMDTYIKTHDVDVKLDEYGILQTTPKVRKLKKGE